MSNYNSKGTFGGKSEINIRNGVRWNKPLKKLAVDIQTDNQGNITYPIEITATLKILNLGFIDFKRPGFHSSSNIYPIGYKATRDHQSCVKPNGRAHYTCEILEQNDKPVFRVTSSEFPNDSVVKDSCSGAWMVFANKINELSQARKGKVTISGPDRYGFGDH